MNIQTVFDINQKVKARVDGGDAEGTVTAIRAGVWEDGTIKINYVVAAKWVYQSPKGDEIFTKDQIYTEPELQEINP